MSKRPLSPTLSSADKRLRHDSTEFLSQYASTYRFRLGNPNQLVITNDGAAILFLRASSSRSFTHDLWQFVIETQQESVVCTAEQILSGASDTLNDEEKQRRERMRQASRGIASFRVAPNGHTILIPLSSHLYLVDRITHDIRMITTSSHAYPNYPTFSRDAKWVSCVRDGDIWIHSTVVDGVEYRLTKRVGEHITNGMAEFVAQEEMARFSGYWWSPDSMHLCYQQTDTSGMEVMHISDPTSPEKPPSTFPYPRPGKQNARVTLAIVDISICRHEKLTTEDRKDGHIIPDPIWVSWNHDTHPYLTTVKWSSRAPLTCCVQNREQTELIVYSIDHINGKTTEIHVEKDSKWLNLDQEVPHYLPDGYHFLWTTEREGAWQLELRDRSGRRLRALTDPSLGFRKLLGVFPKHACCYVAASQDPTQQHIYKVQLGVIPPVTTSGGETSPLQLSSPRPPTSVTIPLSPTNSSPLLTAAAMPTLVSAAASSPSSSPLSSPCAPRTTPPSTTSLHPPSSPSLNAVSSSPRSALHVPPSPSTQSASSLSSSPMPAIALTRDPGIHNATFLAHHDLYIHECVTLTHPIITTIRRLDGTAIATLTSVAEKPTSLPNVELCTVHEKKFHTAIIKPHDWVEGKKYPVIVYVYGGPCFRVITHDCSQYLIQQWLANHGYVVVSLDGRGTPYRGREWERAIYHNLIRVPLQDQCEGLQALGQLYSYLDLTRVGIYGWSFGGYFSAHAVMQRPDIFRAGVAGAPVAAWEDYDTHYTERYLGTPSSNPSGYHDSSVLTHAPSLTRPLLIAHGTADDNVYFAHALKMSNTLFRAKREHDFLPLVDFTHMVTDPVINIALYTRILNHFEKHVHHITTNNTSSTSH